MERDACTRSEKVYGVRSTRTKVHDQPILLTLCIRSRQEYPFAILYFTGSSEFNQKMRVMSLESGSDDERHFLTDSVKTTRKLINNLSQMRISLTIWTIMLNLKTGDGQRSGFIRSINEDDFNHGVN